MSLRDFPHSFKEAACGWYYKVPGELALTKKQRDNVKVAIEEGEEEPPTKVKFDSLWPAFTAGAGLFSDGYVNNSIATVNICLTRIYGDTYAESESMSNVTAIAFAGIVLGQLSFGYISDHIARKGGMMAANIILVFFTICCAAATWGVTPEGMFVALTVFRFFLGVGIGAEYPTASVIASEFANQLPVGHRNRYFIWFTNSCICTGYVTAAFVPMVLLWITSPSDRDLHIVWRLTLGLGAIPPFALFFMRRKMKPSASYEKTNMKSAKKFPWWLVIKFYWFRLAIVSIVWFIYNFSVFSFGLYSSYMLDMIIDGDDLYATFGWNVVFNLFYLPGTFIGAFFTDFFGPRVTLAFGLFCQAIIGYAMTAEFNTLKNQVAGFVVVFGFFTAFGEIGPGNNVGCLASKTSATAIRGQYYGIAAAFGKVGAFVGTYVFPVIMRNHGGEGSPDGIRTAFYVSSSLCLFSGILTLFFCPSVGQEAINEEDKNFVQYLRDSGYDLANLGDGSLAIESQDSIENDDEKVGHLQYEVSRASNDSVANNTSSNGSVTKTEKR
ncbi:hypothetical protein FT663_02502 [Candidozyma haemuli var. vulneris]|uniref:Major facilitator superfamily (MFS) profile domain-containing protein n=1 Tax=Candidozyma haemuli TaxID=45357 RepID=A0A2V1B0N3_9ASCO|nr:hypothetical protein CXQ85_005265 [[Candida] haemuloni]KAF3991943.1 hypothetical protein FT663_02502 [[Candida] haemuloni var. vulneris]PVH22691.1 hypothetical protein CXQ85_005265 [[Candida] haemuloni]